MKIILILFLNQIFTVFVYSNGKKEDIHRVFKEKLAEEALKESQIRLSERRLNVLIKDHPNRFSFESLKQINRKPRKTSTVESIHTILQPYHPVTLAFIGKYDMKILPKK